jgi:hypothetical protein
MERFIRRENIKRYRKLLGDAKDEAERRLIQKLLTELEQKKLAKKTPSRPEAASAVLSDALERPKPKVEQTC